MRKLFRLTVLIATMLAFSGSLMAQVTTGSLMGFVKDANGDPLPGAFVKVTHVPSGTTYNATTQVNGRYTIPAVRVGRDFEVEVSFIGHVTQKITGVAVTLGDPTVLDVQLEEETTMLTETTIVAKRKTAATERTGAAISVGQESITNLPSISRSINDFTRLTPQAKGNSFAGRDGRYNHITIDGSAFNNSFGLSGSTRNLPGGDAQPISLDAIEEISVSIAPYDVRQSNFTGASVNAITKSGTNIYKGSFYTYQRPESFTGTKVGDVELNLDKRSTQTWGGSVGGKIIENKLFFFVNGEYESSKYPSTSWKPSTNGIADGAAYISRTSIDSLKKLKNHLENTYGYNPGGWDYGQFSSENYKILARLDWNINRTHKLSVRYNQVVSTNDVLPNATSAPNPRLSVSRISEKAFAFTNSAYYFENTVQSVTAELNSVFQSKFSNKLLATFTNIRDKRGSNSDIFPFVDIMEGGDPYTTFGYELFTYNNDVKNRTISVIDNFTAYLGAHTLTAGISFEYMYFGNAYLRYGTSYYRYDSMDDFINDRTPSLFAVTYGFNNTDPYSELEFAMGGVYVQDEWQVNRNLKLTGGIRFEMPFYLNKLQSNDAISAIDFNGVSFDVSKWPDQQLLVSPRIGFNWDALGDRSLQVRGGTGIFTGRLPFVWFTNQPTNSAVLQNTVELTGGQLPAGFGFNPDWNAQIANNPTLFPNNPGQTVPSTLAVVSRDFKMPQVWRSSIAADYELPWDMTFTLEGIYSKDINAILQQNVNEKDPTLNFAGADNRPYYDRVGGKYDNRINSATSSAMILDNINEGYQYSITAQLTKAFSYGLAASVAYTYSQAKDVSANPGDQAASAWSSNVAVGSLNNPGLSYSNFSLPHRVVGSLSYTFGYVNSAASTTISLFYEGTSQGRLSYVYSNDMNGDGMSSDLMYIPRDASEIVFKNMPNMTAQEQSDAFFKFVEQDDYLSKNKGKYAERYGAVMPWRNQFDLKFMQEFVMDNKLNTKLQITLDILNVGNLLNPKWGTRKAQIVGSYDNLPLLKFEGVDASNRPTFSLNGVSKAIDYYTDTYKDVLGYGSTWSMQLGLRFIF